MMKSTQARQLVAEEAAKILSEEGQRDHLAAKRKAALRLGLPARHLPTNREIQVALAQRQRLFEATEQAARFERLRRAALNAMAMFNNFEARAVGAVVGNMATAHDIVQLHLFTDAPQSVAFRLADLNLAWHEGSRRMRWSDGRQREVPLFTVQIAGQSVDVLVFTLTELREAPADPVHGRPMVRLNRTRLERLIDQQV